MATNVKILLRRGLRSEISASTLDAGELGYTTDSKQLYVGTSVSVDEIIFDPFTNAHSIVQTFLNTITTAPLNGLEINEDLIISIPTNHTAGSFVTGVQYTIVTTGTTDFTLIGAADSVVGTVFTATGVGTGTGTAQFDGVSLLLTAMANYGIITAGAFEPTVSVTAGSFVVGTEYTIATAGTTDFTLIGATDSVVGTVFTATGIGAGTGTATYGKEYKIKTTGTTDYTLIGAADNNVGTVFTTTGVGTGTGTAIDTYDHFYANIFASERKNVEVLTENSFSQVYANMHLQSQTSADGRRPSLFKKDLATTSGTFLKYAKTDSTSFFIDYSLKQVGTSPAITFVRVGRLQVINGAAVTPAIAQAKLTDNNTEIWQDDGDSIAQADEFSNIEFTSVIDGDNMKINYTQDANFTTEISYTVKRWTM